MGQKGIEEPRWKMGGAREKDTRIRYVCVIGGGGGQGGGEGREWGLGERKKKMEQGDDKEEEEKEGEKLSRSTWPRVTASSKGSHTL